MGSSETSETVEQIPHLPYTISDLMCSRVRREWRKQRLSSGSKIYGVGFLALLGYKGVGYPVKIRQHDGFSHILFIAE